MFEEQTVIERDEDIISEKEKKIRFVCLLYLSALLRKCKIIFVCCISIMCLGHQKHKINELLKEHIANEEKKHTEKGNLIII